MSRQLNTSFLLILFTSLFTLEARQHQSNMDNPLLKSFGTPFGVPPFNKIQINDYLPAFEAGMQQQKEEISAITSNPAPPDFFNTIEALEKSGALLKSTSRIFFNLNAAHTSDEMQKIAQELAPKLSAHYDDISLNKPLFERIKSVYQQKSSLKLSPEQQMLLDETYKNFIRGGAGIAPENEGRFREINERISVLTLQFGQNVLSENNSFLLLIDKEEDLSGLPDNLKKAASDEASKRGHSGKWAFTLHNPSVMPFLQYADHRGYREQMLKAYLSRGDNDNELDNKQIIRELVALRAERAQMLGYENHAAFVLEESMAKTPANVNELLDKLWNAALPIAKKELEDLQQMANQEGADFVIQPWDWRYYAEKVRRQRYDFDENELKPYFSLDQITKGIFEVCKRLYGLQFVQRTDLPVYHEECSVYEVKEANGDHVGILYLDFHPRASKRGGAWMTSYRQQSTENGQRIHPVISIVCNFSRPSGNTPALLTFEEVSTYFHEFGHALHGLLSNTVYESLSGTSVPRDFVELPSQIMENWAAENEVLKLFARHYQTGEVIPDELLEKRRNAQKFDQGFATVEYLAASILDIQYHMLKAGDEVEDVRAFEKAVMDKIGLISAIPPRYRSTYFNHIFSGGYSAGYYSYIWSAVLDADAFEVFKEKGLFDQASALSFRKNILEKGGSIDPMQLYINFRGAEPSIEPLLKRRGLLAE
jgi:peptidyl-dipeptidase Dcp